MNNTAYAKLTSGLIAAWFLLALAASALHLFVADASQPPIALGLAVLLPLTVFFVWFATSPSFRSFTLSLSPHTLTLVHSWRIAGFTFLALYSAGLLPAVFALPAGLGDIAIGLTSYLAAQWSTNFHRRRRFIVWQVLGIFDLVLAIALGMTSRLIAPHGASTGIMTMLPMSLIPTFAVPLLILLHVICIAQARKWKPVDLTQTSELIHHPA
jgi:hypothetical protein